MKILEKLKKNELSIQEKKEIFGGISQNGSMWYCVTAKGGKINFPQRFEDELASEIDAYNNSCCAGDYIVGCDYEWID